MWAFTGECKRNAGFMNVQCQRSCHSCKLPDEVRVQVMPDPFLALRGGEPHIKLALSSEGPLRKGHIPAAVCGHKLYCSAAMYDAWVTNVSFSSRPQTTQLCLRQHAMSS